MSDLELVYGVPEALFPFFLLCPFSPYFGFLAQLSLLFSSSVAVFRDSLFGHLLVIIIFLSQAYPFRKISKSAQSELRPPTIYPPVTGLPFARTSPSASRNGSGQRERPTWLGSSVWHGSTRSCHGHGLDQSLPKVRPNTTRHHETYNKQADNRSDDSSTNSTALSHSGTIAFTSITNAISVGIYSLATLLPAVVVKDINASNSKTDEQGYSAMKSWYEERCSEQPWNGFIAQQRKKE